MPAPNPPLRPPNPPNPFRPPDPPPAPPPKVPCQTAKRKAVLLPPCPCPLCCPCALCPAETSCPAKGRSACRPSGGKTSGSTAAPSARSCLLSKGTEGTAASGQCGQGGDDAPSARPHTEQGMEFSNVCGGGGNCPRFVSLGKRSSVMSHLNCRFGVKIGSGANAVAPCLRRRWRRASPAGLRPVSLDVTLARKNHIFTW